MKIHPQIKQASPLFCAVLLFVSCGAHNSASVSQPAGQKESASTKTLETGANVLQNVTPVKQFDIYLVGFHPMKDNPSMQMEAHHYCNQVNEDFAQCVLFDGNTKTANMNGLEYIISEKLFNTLPAEERKYWHPHNYEILSGELIGPGLPKTAEKLFMQKKMNSYGKTWHVWMTDNNGKPADKMPLGAPHLAWSFNHDGEIKPAMIEKRDKEMGMNTENLRQERQDLVSAAHSQSGVDDLKGRFSGPVKPIPGVTDLKAAQK